MLLFSASPTALDLPKKTDRLPIHHVSHHKSHMPLVIVPRYYLPK